MSSGGKTVRILPKAEEDISQSAEFLADDSLDAALRFLSSVQSAMKFISAYPEAGSN